MEISYNVRNADENSASSNGPFLPPVYKGESNIFLKSFFLIYFIFLSVYTWNQLQTLSDGRIFLAGHTHKPETLPGFSISSPEQTLSGGQERLSGEPWFGWYPENSEGLEASR